VVRLLSNPMTTQAGVVLFLAAGALALGIWMIRELRKSIMADAEIDSAAAPKLENLPMHLYNTVIQQLKQQKHELQVQTLAEQRRARTTENFSQAVLSNLSSGVLVFGMNGLVKQANPAAKQILGFSSPFSMSAADIFREGTVCSSARTTGHSPSCLQDEIDAVLHHGGKCRQVEADYTTPAGKSIPIAVTISPVPSVDGGLLGVACLISDRSEFEQLRHQQELQGEMSAEMALELRTSLATITSCAQQLTRQNDAGTARRLAEDIASEAARLDRNIGGFLAARRASAGTVS
jgi:PAS domain-containing protein